MHDASYVLSEIQIAVSMRQASCLFFVCIYHYGYDLKWVSSLSKEVYYLWDIFIKSLVCTAAKIELENFKFFKLLSTTNKQGQTADPIFSWGRGVLKPEMSVNATLDLLALIVPNKL